MAIKYFTMNLEEASKKGYKDSDGKILEPDWRLVGMFRLDYRLEDDLEERPPNLVTLVGISSDPDAPEDATLDRDYSWVLQELERCAKEINDYEMDHMVRME